MEGREGSREGRLKSPNLHIDADILAYRAAAATDGRMYEVKYWGPEQPIVVLHEPYKKDADKVAKRLEKEGYDTSVEITYTPEPIANAIHIMKKAIASLETQLKYHCDGLGSFHYYLSRGGSFREKEYPLYKANRKDMRRPHNLEACKDWLVSTKRAVVRIGELEADDLMAMRKEEGDIICSIDKDLLQVPGHHFNWVRNEYKVVSEEDGRRSLYIQMLTGDSTDGIPGIKGIGPVTAKKLLGGIISEYLMYCVVLKTYIEKTPRLHEETEESFHIRVIHLVRAHARLLYLLRSPEDSWEPPTEGT